MDVNKVSTCVAAVLGVKGGIFFVVITHDTKSISPQIYGDRAGCDPLFPDK